MCSRLKDEFPDISISKIRYLEDQGLLAPRRTQGGYRLYSEDDVERLETILRLQRDEFLPLRVIREELARRRAAPRGARGRAGLQVPGGRGRLRTLCDRAGAEAAFVRELEDYGLIEPQREWTATALPRADVDVVAPARGSPATASPRATSQRSGAADNEADLLEQIVAPELRSPNPEKRHAGLEDLEKLAALSQELSQLLFWRALRSLVPRS